MTRTQEHTISLTRAALTGQAPRIGCLCEQEWLDIYAFARKHGVSALCYHAVLQLPKDQQPPKKLFLQWGLSYETTIQRSKQQKNAALKLWKNAHDMHADISILKGLSIARYYPNPELRECGDIDIYCFGKHHDLNRWIEKQGIPVDYGNKRHSIFTIYHTTVENHGYFLYAGKAPEEVSLEKLLVGEALKDLHENPDSLLLGTPLGTAVFFLKHAEKHFVFDRTNIQLRSLCDWAMMLKSGTFDYHELKKNITGNSIERFADMMTFLCVELFGLPEDLCKGLQPFPKKVIDNAKQLIFSYQHQTEKRGTFSGRLQRFFKYLKYKKTYRSIFGKNIIKWYYFS